MTKYLGMPGHPLSWRSVWPIILLAASTACEPVRFDVDAGDAEPDAGDAGPTDSGDERDTGLRSEAGEPDADGGTEPPDSGVLRRISVLRTGDGRVSSSPGAIDCGERCDDAFLHGTDVVLTASAAVGSTFIGWGGADCSASPTCTVLADRDRSISAAFAPLRYTLQVATSGTGAGTVSSASPGIECGSDCSESYAFGERVTLTVTPAMSSSFGGWSGDCSGLGPTCTILMDRPRTVTASFDFDEYSLSVQLGGTGGGEVTSNVGAIVCPGSCTGSFAPDTVVTLTARADTLSRFDGWVGPGCSGTGTCTVTMTTATAVTAIFTDISHPLAVTRDGTGAGTVISNPVGIACGNTCTARFVTGESVDLIATAAPGSRFDRWSGACAGQPSTCSITVSAATSVSAHFEENRVLQVALGLSHSCALLVPGVVRCWGEASDGQLGYGDTVDRGDGLGPAANAADVPLALPAGVTIAKLVAGAWHTCVLLSNGAIRCWGQNTYGQLGYGDRNPRGGTAATIPPTDVPMGGALVADLAAGDWHTCARLDSGALRCWGRGTWGLTAAGNTNDQLSANGPNVAFAGTPTPTVVDIATSAAHSCALLSTGRVRCWGRGLFGTLGYGDELDRGDSAATVPLASDVPLGNITIQRILPGISTGCVLHGAGLLRCWGHGGSGQFGDGTTAHRGNDAADNLQQDVPLGLQILSAALGTHTCAIVPGDELRCWGDNGRGQLGLGDTVPRAGPDLSNTRVPLGGPVSKIAIGIGNHTCAILTSGALRCWGPNDAGQLGYGDRIQRGDGTGPGPTVDVPIF